MRFQPTTHTLRNETSRKLLYLIFHYPKGRKKLVHLLFFSSQKKAALLLPLIVKLSQKHLPCCRRRFLSCGIVKQVSKCVVPLAELTLVSLYGLQGGAQTFPLLFCQLSQIGKIFAGYLSGHPVQKRFSILSQCQFQHCHLDYLGFVLSYHAPRDVSMQSIVKFL